MFRAEHRLTGQQVVIKAICKTKYKYLTRYNGVSESGAMYLCEANKNVLTIVDEFKMGQKVYVVTKLAKGGDLINYLQAKGVDRLPEE